MDNKFQSSFIPKKPLVGADVASHRAPVSVFGLIGLILFILSIVAAVGSFFWVQVLQKQVAENEQTLKKARDTFRPDLIKELRDVNDRIVAANELLGKHLALSNFFALLQSATLKSVRFTGLTYTYGPKDVKVTMTGQADSFVSVALQSEVLSKNESFKNPVISELSLTTNGNVTFTATANVDAKVFAYQNTAAAPTDSVSGQQSSIITTPLNLPQI